MVASQFFSIRFGPRVWKCSQLGAKYEYTQIKRVIHVRSKSWCRGAQKLGLVKQIFPKESFQENAHEHLKEMLRERSGKSMIEVKHLKNISMRYQRIVALFNACNALAERFVDGEPIGRMAAKMQDLNGIFASAKNIFALTDTIACDSAN